MTSVPVPTRRLSKMLKG